jgi:hypothetical protein
MIILSINGDEYELPEDIKSEQAIKYYLLSLYKPGDEVVSFEDGIEIDRCLLEDIFRS